MKSIQNSTNQNQPVLSETELHTTSYHPPAIKNEAAQNQSEEQENGINTLNKSKEAHLIMEQFYSL